MKKKEIAKTGFGIFGAWKNRKEHKKFEKDISNAQKMALFGNISSSSTNMRVSQTQGNLNRAWHYVKQNLENLNRIFFFHNKLAEKHNILAKNHKKLSKKVKEQQKQIHELKEKLNI